MAENLDAQIRKALWESAKGRMSLDEFRGWFVPLSWNIEQSGEPEAIALAHQIDGILAEASSAGWTEEEIHEELARPFAARQVAETVVGDPSPFPIPQSSAEAVSNCAVAA